MTSLYHAAKHPKPALPLNALSCGTFVPRFLLVAVSGCQPVFCSLLLQETSASTLAAKEARVARTGYTCDICRCVMHIYKYIYIYIYMWIHRERSNKESGAKLLRFQEQTAALPPDEPLAEALCPSRLPAALFAMRTALLARPRYPGWATQRP